MMKTIGMSTMLLLSTLFVVGCVTGPEWEPPQEILNPQASAEQHPPGAATSSSPDDV